MKSIPFLNHSRRTYFNLFLKTSLLFAIPFNFLPSSACASPELFILKIKKSKKHDRHRDDIYSSLESERELFHYIETRQAAGELRMVYVEDLDHYQWTYFFKSFAAYIDLKNFVARKNTIKTTASEKLHIEKNSAGIENFLYAEIHLS